MSKKNNFCRSTYLLLVVAAIRTFHTLLGIGLSVSSIDDSLYVQSLTSATRYPCLSFSVFGNDSLYTYGILKTVKDTRIIYDDWLIKVYHNDDLSYERVKSLERIKGVLVINVKRHMPFWVSRYVNPKSWRFLVASDRNVSYFGVRDGDSRPSHREKSAVDEWIKSGKQFHTMHDHPLHHPRTIPIFAGMWGGISGLIPNFTSLIRHHYESLNWSTRIPFPYDEDQQFLQNHVYPIILDSCMKHDSYYCAESGGIGFPVKRQDTRDRYDFVGNCFNKISSPNDTLYRRDPMLYSKKFRKRYINCLEKRNVKQI
jgi:hypothetical protein